MFLDVTMSVAKLLSRIVAPSANEFSASTEQGRTLDDHTYGKAEDGGNFKCRVNRITQF
jgi:hypothetical protein